MFLISRLTQKFLSEQDRWFLWTPVVLALGIAFYFLLPSEPSLIALVLIVEAFLFLFYLCHQNGHLFFIFLTLFIFSLGTLNIKLHTYFRDKNISMIADEETTYLQGRLFKVDYNNKGKMRLWLEDVSDFDNPRLGYYRVTLPSKPDLRLGSCFELVATLMPPSAPLTPHGFQFDRHAFYQGISATGYAESSVFETDCLYEPHFKDRILDSIAVSRQKIAKYIKEHLSEQNAAIASAILVGDKSLIDESLYEQYRNSGLAHFLAISGLHMGFVAMFVFFVIRLILVFFPFMALNFSSKKVASFFAILFCLIYLILSGVSISATRAFIMTSLVFLGFIFDRQAISMRTVAVAAFVILMIEPQVLLSPSFQMSFAAVTALVAFYEVFRRKFNFSKVKPHLYVLYYFVGVLITTFVATLATLPFTFYHFGTFAPYALLGNLLAAPLIAFIIMPFIFLSLLLLPVHLGLLPLKVVGFGLFLLNKLTAFVSSLPHAGILIPQMPFWGFLLITIGGLWLTLWRRKWRFYGLILIFAGFLSFCFLNRPEVLYSSNGKNVALKAPNNHLFIFARKENNFINQIWAQNYKGFTFSDKLQTVQPANIKCKNGSCTYLNVFEFDLNKHLKLNSEAIDFEADDGGAIYFHEGKAKKKTIRSIIGHRPWNTLKQKKEEEKSL